MNSILAKEFDHLSEKGVLGNYDQFEVIEVMGFQNKSSTPTNVFTLLVATEGRSVELPVGFINKKGRIELKELSTWTFGIHRRWLNLNQVTDCLERFNSTHKWEVESGKPVRHGPLSPKAVQFVPANSFGKVPLNRLIKNNFWAGSHIIELADAAKSKLYDLLNSPKLLLQLSEEIQKFIPLEIGAMSDRLGNVVFQFPVESLRCQFFKSKDKNFCSVEVAWHPNVPERRLIAQMEVLEDQAITSFGCKEIRQSGIHHVMPNPGYGLFRGTLWDAENNILLAASDQVSLITEINLNLGMISPEPRIFKHKGDEHRINIQTTDHLSVFEDEGQSKSHKQTWARLYSEEKKALKDRKELIQFRAPFSTTAHDDAMQDIRWLIQKHGQYGAWLWDPYLSADDVIRTLFFSPHGGSELRALTALKQAPSDSSSKNNQEGENRRQTLVKDYRNELSDCAGINSTGLKLEFRESVSKKFHDRFLIFPRPQDEPLAWALGTSVKSMGTSHHILQQVQNGRLIFEAFDDFWRESAQEKNLIWSS